MPSDPRPATATDGPWLRSHWPLGLVVLAGAVVRVLTMLGYPPALLFPDSWGYIATAYSGAFAGLPTVHPVGYPVLIRLLTLPDRSLAELVAFQHLAGIGVGVAIYLALIRARLPRWAAAAAAALVLLDGYAITLEQYVMSDTFFTLLMLAAALVLVWPFIGAAPRATPTPRSLLARGFVSGLLVALATLVREVSPFTIPVFLVYLVWVRAGWRPLAAFLVAAAIPLLCYSALIDHRFHVFGLTATPGWTLYGRVAGFADCNGVKLEPAARGLCETSAQRASHPRTPDWYIWGPSPAQRLFHPATQPVSKVAPTNQVLESFSRAIIRQEPLDFLSATVGDFLRYFTPDATPYNDAVSATTLPKSAGAEASSPATQRRDLPGVHPSVRAPAGFVRAYRGVIHVPRPVLALLALAAVLAVCLRVPARREVFLLVGSALVILLGTAASGGFALRYLLPAVPLLAIGGSLAVAQLSAGARRPRRARRAR
ncbi:MAG TPA: phospholipid carrier-dependent glycosyltransferase [Solirubrobacteraceae bacterium]|nr:phospholipid carrier-dependent glycosyltransferase [Solirubrobacteraceae bacterium]